MRDRRTSTHKPQRRPSRSQAGADSHPLTLDLLPHRHAVCRLPPDAPVEPAWMQLPGIVSLTRTEEELSLVMPEEHAPANARCERGFRALRVHGPLAFGMTGILAGLTTALADAGVSVFAISTFNTDILFVREEDMPRALAALRKAGHTAEE